MIGVGANLSYLGSALVQVATHVNNHCVLNTYEPFIADCSRKRSRVSPLLFHTACDVERELELCESYRFMPFSCYAISH